MQLQESLKSRRKEAEALQEDARQIKERMVCACVCVCACVHACCALIHCVQYMYVCTHVLCTNMHCLNQSP